MNETELKIVELAKDLHQTIALLKKTFPHLFEIKNKPEIEVFQTKGA